MIGNPDRTFRADRLVNGKAIYHAKPRRKLHWRVKEYLVWAVLIFVAILAWWGFKP